MVNSNSLGLVLAYHGDFAHGRCAAAGDSDIGISRLAGENFTQGIHSHHIVVARVPQRLDEVGILEVAAGVFHCEDELNGVERSGFDRARVQHEVGDFERLVAGGEGEQGGQ